MVRYRAAIEAGGDLQEITQWINAAKAERTQAEAALRTMLCRGLDLMLSYQPTTQTVRSEARLTVGSHGVMVRVRGAIAPKYQCVLAGEFAVGGWTKSRRKVEPLTGTPLVKVAATSMANMSGRAVVPVGNCCVGTPITGSRALGSRRESSDTYMRAITGELVLGGLR